MGISIAAHESPRKNFAVQDVAPFVAPDFLWVMDAVRIVWPRKTAEVLHDITGASLRSCKYWLAGMHASSGLPLLRLLRALRRELEQRLRTIEALEFNKQ